MKYKRIAAGVLAAAALLIAALPPASADTPVPQAVSVDAPAEEAVLLDSRLSLREEGETHKKYLNGNDFGMFEPSKALTRAEAAQIFYILLDEPPETGGSFRDVPENAWFAQAAGSLAREGIIIGDKDGLFHPDSPFTRAECAAAAAYFLPSGGFPFLFHDVQQDNPYYSDICIAAANGLFSAADPLFRPDDPLTRAEAAIVFNRLLGRSPDVETIASSPEVRFFPDVPQSHWAYAHIMEASIGHVQQPGAHTEQWTSLNEERCPLADGFHNIGGSLYCVREGQFVHNETVRGFWFGENGRLATGNSALGTALAEVILTRTNENMTSGQKLRAVYNYVRDNFTYIKRKLVSKGQTGWEPAYAEAFLRDGRGNCFGYAATFCLLARELGYDARTVVGWLGKNRQPHGWVEIELDGTTYVYDAELEMKYRSSNFFQARYGSTRFAYYKN